MRTSTPSPEVVIDVPLRVGEGPCWSAEEQALYFVDILAPALFRLDAGTRALRRWTMPSSIGSFGLCADGRMVVALRDGVYRFDPHSEALTLLCRPEPDRPRNRLNDGKVGPDGRFWVGSMDDRPEKEAVAALYRIDTAGRCERMLDGLIVSNGLAWTKDGRTLFHSDSRAAYVQAFDFDPVTGDPSNRRLVRTLTDAEGRPDGAAFDVEGYYWSAGVSAGVLNRIAPDGRIDRRVVLPVAAPTMPCFGGPDLKTLYVTSLSSDRLGAPQAGTLLRFDVDVPGVPVQRFGAPLKSAGAER
jgi:sugar lactone lactonase YvrE